MESLFLISFDILTKLFEENIPLFCELKSFINDHERIQYDVTTKIVNAINNVL